jgi:hypothetical protein
MFIPRAVGACHCASRQFSPYRLRSCLGSVAVKSHVCKPFDRTFFIGASLVKFHVFWNSLGKHGCFTFPKGSRSKREDSPVLNLPYLKVVLGSRGAKLHALSALY